MAVESSQPGPDRRVPPALDREQLVASKERELVRGSLTKADVWVSRLSDGRHAVVKEFLKPWPVSWWGRVQIRREIRVLQLLADFEEVPHLYGTVAPNGFAMELVEGDRLVESRDQPLRREALPKLQQTMAKIHELGIAHLDLRGRENVHLKHDGAVVVIDWAGAIILRPRSLMHRLFFSRLKLVDEAALIKWKRLLAPETVTDADREAEHRFLRWRRLWPFNRKGVGRANAAAPR